MLRAAFNLAEPKHSSREAQGGSVVGSVYLPFAGDLRDTGSVPRTARSWVRCQPTRYSLLKSHGQMSLMDYTVFKG